MDIHTLNASMRSTPYGKPTKNWIVTVATTSTAQQANTFYYNIKFEMWKAFMMVFEMSITTKRLSFFQKVKGEKGNQITSWSFMH